MADVKFERGSVMIDDKPTQIISGAIHYFRVPRPLWADRLLKAKQMGLNAVETYLCWNLHEQKPGKFDFTGGLDFEAFVKMIGELGMHAIVRPGPYICAEWDNGGIPAWLMVKPGVEFRRMNKPYIDATERFVGEIIPRLKKLQFTEGGPVIAVQIENEYGSYGQDKEYLRHLRGLYEKGGISVPLFTADGAADICIQGGMLEGSPMTLTFGSRGLAAFATGRKYRPEGPDFCTEFWNGWFDHWGSPHHTRDVADAAKELDEMLGAGGSVNLYMFHGGTNFGFNNGANGSGATDYGPDVTSYDYDAPLSECGDPSEKFFAFQNVIRKYRPNAEFGTPAPMKKQAYGLVTLKESSPLFENLDRLSKKRPSTSPMTMEALGQSFGFIHYRARLNGPMNDSIRFLDMHDRAMVFLDGQYQGSIYRNDPKQELGVAIPATGATLDVLVENMGRINYGPRTGKDLKGLVGGVLLCFGQFQFNWENWPLPMDNLKKLRYGAFAEAYHKPCFHRAKFKVDAPCDTFLKFPGEKGVVWINGFNLGRYWGVGPGKTLYVPGCLLKPGKNEVIIFELHKLNSQNIEFIDKPILD